CTLTDGYYWYFDVW
nr:immunoglobulin heavy chain junction region [Mus musculus]